MENTKLITVPDNLGGINGYDKGFTDSSLRFSFDSLSNDDAAKFNFEMPDLAHFTNIFALKDYFKDTAIINLLKKTKFLQLYIRLIENQITEEEYEQEIEENSDDFYINLKAIQSDLDYIALTSVLQKLPKKLSVDDVSEIFGIQQESLFNRILN